MGQFTKADVSIMFKNGVPEAFESGAALKEALLGFFLETNPQHKGRVDIYITEHLYEVTGRAVDLEVYSENYNNCEFQADLIRDYLVSKHPTEVGFFSVIGYTAADDLGSTFSDEDDWNYYVNEK